MLLISDLDGTAIDSEGLILASYQHVITTHQLRPRTPIELRSYIGTALRELYSTWAPPSEVDSLYETHRAFQLENRDLVRAMPGIPETFRELRSRGVKIAICTNRSASASEFLTSTGLAPLIDRLVTVDDVPAKPNPEGLHVLMRYFCMGPDKSWIMGDTPIDIQAGKNAGIRTIAALFGPDVNASSFKHTLPDHFISSPTTLLKLIV